MSRETNRGDDTAASTLPLTREEIERLATYNSEVARGIVHTEEYDMTMARLQRAFVREQRRG